MEEVAAFHNPPRVRLLRSFEHPFASVVEAARTCYAAKGVVEGAEVGERGEALARDLYRAGHHTTFQHAYFQFAIEGVSRQAIWSLLHAHPFYNSEQVSQRYVAVAPEACLLPRLPPPAEARFRDCLALQMAAYRDLTELLTPVAAAAYFDRFPGRAKAFDRYATALRRRAQEVARYVLPLATTAHLVHTISGLTLLRYQRACLEPDAPTEQRAVVAQMAAAVVAVDPAYRSVLESPRGWEAPAVAGAEVDRPRAGAFAAEFDRRLGGNIARLVSAPSENVAVTAAAVREVLGLPAAALSDVQAVELLLAPECNPLMGEPLNLHTMDKLGRCLAHAHFTFAKRLSHTADSQDQRHRATPGSRPVLTRHYTGEPDYVTPALFAEAPAAAIRYRATMEAAWEAIEALLAGGVAPEVALYLLPNAVNLRFTESADLGALHHKHRMRLCYNAQEEIWRASLEEALQIRAVQPEIGRHLLPPCTHRLHAGVKPICPEGERYCGVRVWRLGLDEYARSI